MTQNELQQALLAAAGVNSGSGAGTPPISSALVGTVTGTAEGDQQSGTDAARQLADNLAQLTRQLTDLKQSSQQQMEGLDANTKATLENTIARLQQGGSSVASTAGSVLSAIGSTLTLSPIIGGLIKLFGGGGSDPQPALPVYTAPPSIRAEGAPGLTGTASVDAISYGQDGVPRRVDTVPAVQAATPVTIQVQTIDSRSFLDHSDSIARAVRDAMLNMHSLNDVIQDL